MNSSSVNYNTNRVDNYPAAYTKSLGIASGGAKALGTAVGADPTSAAEAWKEQNQSIWDAIQSGTSGLSDSDIQQFTDWWNYNEMQLGGSSWDPSMGSDGGVSGDPASQAPAPAPLPPGAILGTSNNIVYNTEGDDIIADGDPRNVDIYRKTVNIDDASESSKWTVEKTTDTRLNPPTPVIKLTRFDVATGQTTTYFIDNPNAVVKISTPDQSQVTDPSSAVTWGEYSPPAADGSTSGATPSFKGGEVTQDGLNYSHTALAGETIDFTPQPNPDGVEVHEVYGDCTITLRSDYHANISQVDSDSHKIIVTDKDGNEIAEYIVHDGFKTSLNMNENYCTVTGNGQTNVPIKDYDGTNSFWTDDFSLNGEQGNKVANGDGTGDSSTADPTSVQGYIDASNDDFLKALSNGDVKKVQEFVDLFGHPNLDAKAIKDLLSKHDLVDELRYGSDLPSQKMINFIWQHDDKMKYYMKHIKDGDSDLLTDRLTYFLKGMGYDAHAHKSYDNDVGESTSDNIKIGDNEMEVHWDDFYNPTDIDLDYKD